MKPRIGDKVKTKYFGKLLTIRMITINSDGEPLYHCYIPTTDRLVIYDRNDIELVHRETLTVIADYRKDNEK